MGIACTDQEKLKDEFAQILLVEGNHHDFIEEIEEITSSLDKKNNDNEYLNELYLSLDKKGFIAKNPNRATSRTRKFLTAEKQLWGHLDIIKKDGVRYFFKDQGYFFKKKRIETLIEEFY